jgi:hypothetical protein
MDNNRIAKYEARDDWKAGPHIFGRTIYEHKFCIDCRSKECSNMSHNHIELHPIIRIPKQRANKKKWRIFFELVDHFGEDNKRRKRH